MALGTIGLSTYRWNNVYKALCLVALFPAICFFVLWWQTYAVVAYFSDASEIYQSNMTNDFIFGWGGGVILFLLLSWLIYSWNYHSSIIRGMVLSASVDAKTEPKLYAILERICISQGLPTPQMEILETMARNSFVCSDGEGASCLFITRGLLEALSEDEIEAVIAHEMAHIINSDTRLLSFTIAFSDLFPYLISKIQVTRAFEAPAPKNDIELDEFAGACVLFILLFPLWVAYFLTSVLRIFLFMNREHDADAMALQITKNPDALMRALKRIHRRARMPYGSSDLKLLCIDNPVGGIFATHPGLSSRLALISALGNCPVPQIENSQSAPIHKRFNHNPLLKRTFKDKHSNSPWL